MVFVHLFLSTIVVCHLPLHRLDIKNAFFHGDSTNVRKHGFPSSQILAYNQSLGFGLVNSTM